MGNFICLGLKTADLCIYHIIIKQSAMILNNKFVRNNLLKKAFLVYIYLMLLNSLSPLLQKFVCHDNAVSKTTMSHNNNTQLLEQIVEVETVPTTNYEENNQNNVGLWVIAICFRYNSRLNTLLRQSFSK